MFRKTKILFFPGSIIKRFTSSLAKRVFLLKQYEGTVKKVWGTEFVLKSMKEAREVVRREYDKLSEDVDAATIALNKNDALEIPDKNVKESLEKAIETKKAEIEEWKKKVDLADETIGQLTDQIVGYRENLPRLEKEINES